MRLRDCNQEHEGHDHGSQSKFGRGEGNGLRDVGNNQRN